MGITLRDLKAQIFDILARLRRGKIVEVVRHHNPAIGCVGIPERANHELVALVEEGLVSWNGDKPSFPEKRHKLYGGGMSVSEMTLEDRS